MSYLVVDAHVHLWEKLYGWVNGMHVKSKGRGRAIINGEIRQMMPPYMLDGRNMAETLISNMDFAGVSAVVVTQEYIDGEQNRYLMEVQKAHADRFMVCGLAEFREAGYVERVKMLVQEGFKAIKIPAQWLVTLPERVCLNSCEMIKVFKFMEQNGVILSIDLAQDSIQTAELEEVIQECPALKIAIGHFGMVNRPGWNSQIKLARYQNVSIESGGITWLFHSEFYPYGGAVRAIKQAIDMVGVEKLMWGSDYPRTMTVITYKMSFDFIVKTPLLTLYEKQRF